MAPIRQMLGRRFSEDELSAFGRWTFLGGSKKTPGQQTFDGATRKTSFNRVSRSSSTPAGLSTPSHSIPACAMDLGYDQESVQGMLQKMLPSTEVTTPCAKGRANRGMAWRSPGHPAVDALGAEGVGAPSPTASVRFFSPESASCSDNATRRHALAGDRTWSHGASRKFQQPILERFRQKLLERYLSLHDAFSRLDHGVSRDRAFNYKEFHGALERLGVAEEDSEELFVALDKNSDGGVSLSEFLHALVDVSPQALLWELRCRLIRLDIGPGNLRKALELVQWPQHGWQSKATEIKRRTSRHVRQCHACAAGLCCSCPTKSDGFYDDLHEFTEPEAAVAQVIAKRSSYHLPRGDWLKFCTSICLTLLEAERLFLFLADDTGMVDLREMYEKLRTTVEPDISLERFTTKVRARYEELPLAFKEFCEDQDSDPEPMLRWAGFHSMAVKLNVNDKNATNIWKVLTSSASDVDHGGSDGGSASNSGICERVFVGQLSLWAPDTALQALEGQMCERFGNLAEGKRALEHRLIHTNPLNAQEFDHRLRCSGIKNPEVQKALSAVASKAGAQASAVSLDAAIHTMRATRRSGSKPSGQTHAARHAVKHETMPLWDQLRTVQRDLRRKYDDEELPDTRATTPESAPQTPKPVTDKRRFSQSVDGAVRLAETSRSKFVLHCAKRQVMGLEERWATNQSPSPAWSPRPPGLPLAPACRSPPRPCDSRGSCGSSKKLSSSCSRSVPLSNSISDPLLSSTRPREDTSATVGMLPDVSAFPSAQSRRVSKQRPTVAKCPN